MKNRKECLKSKMDDLNERDTESKTKLKQLITREQNRDDVNTNQKGDEIQTFRGRETS
jgi:hypothetical protein